MFGSKDRRMQELGAQLDRYTAAEPFLPLAEEIYKKVQTIQGIDVDISEEMGTIVSDLTAENRQAVFSELFGKLAPEDRRNLLLEHFNNDEELKASLERERELLIRKDATQLAMESITIWGGLNVAEIPSGLHLSVALYELEDFQGAADQEELAKHYESERFIRATLLDKGRVRILEDYSCDDSYYRRPPLEAHETVSLGAIPPEGKVAEFEPIIFYGSRLDVMRGNKNKCKPLQLETDYDVHELVVGGVWLGDAQVMGQIPEA